MRQTLTYTPHVTLHPAESAGGRGGWTQTEKEEDEEAKKKNNAFPLFVARSFFSISRLISGFSQVARAAAAWRKCRSCAALSGTLDISDTTLPHKDSGKMYFTRHRRLLHSPGGMLKALLLSGVLVYYALCLSLDGVAPLFDFETSELISCAIFRVLPVIAS